MRIISIHDCPNDVRALSRNTQALKMHPLKMVLSCALCELRPGLCTGELVNGRKAISTCDESWCKGDMRNFVWTVQLCTSVAQRRSQLQLNYSLGNYRVWVLLKDKSICCGATSSLRKRLAPLAAGGLGS